MAYTTPSISSAGLSIPSYSDMRDDLIASAKNIYGQDIYLGNDSQDYQFISAVSAKIYDAFQLSQYVYNNRGVSGAIGTALDSIVKINGLGRIPPAYSTCIVRVTGTTGTIITNGIVADASGVQWSLPLTVTIPIAGHIDVIATCQIYGAIVANPGDITTIVTPTYGWTSVTNLVAATLGNPTETDAQLKARQTVSTNRPSQSLLEGTKAAIAAVTNVTRYIVYDNDTNSTDGNTIPAHSISVVVEGGAVADIASAIFVNKGPGCGTYGSTTQTVTDDYGQSTSINFYRPTTKVIDVTVTVKALSGYTTDITAQIKTNVVAYLNSLQIGEDLTISALWGAALTAMNDWTHPLFSITGLTAGLHGGDQSTTDIVIAFNQVTSGSTANVTVTVT